MTNSSSKQLDGRVAIITGAAGGLGAIFAGALAREGAAVVVSDVISCYGTVETIVQAGGRAIGVTADVSAEADMTTLARAAEEAFGGIDILINNAGLFANLRMMGMDEISPDLWDKVMAVNVKGPYLATRAVLPAMRRAGYGKVIHLSSGMGIKGAVDYLHYATSKSAIIGMTRSMARELGPSGIRVNCVAPGLTDTDAIRNHGDWQGDRRANNIAGRAISRAAMPEDIAGTVVYLASTASDFVTGQAVVVDGGSAMV